MIDRHRVTSDGSFLWDCHNEPRKFTYAQRTTEEPVWNKYKNGPGHSTTRNRPLNNSH